MIKRLGGFMAVLETLRGALRFAQALAQMLVIAATLGLWAVSLAAGFGLLPWAQLALSFGDTALPQAGIWLQLGLCALMAVLALYLPANARMARLERSHRSFAVGVQDVAQAYRQAHAADRKGVFALSGEFESMRARLEHLRKHPDFQHLEPELLQLAAQMSHETRDLAHAYSEEKVARAKDFLRQRQHEVDAFNERLATARSLCDDLRRWSTDIKAEELQAQIQIKRLESDLREILPQLGYDLEETREANVVSLPKPNK